MHHHNQHDKVRLVGVVTISMLVGLLAAGRRASAQSLDSSAGVSNASPDDRTIPPDVKSLTIDAPDAPDLPSASDEATTANDVNVSAAPPMGDDPDVEAAPSANAVGSDEASGSASENGAVLEIPQVVDLRNGGSANVPADEASANPESNDDDTALSSRDDEDDTGGESDLTDAGGPVGTLADYQNQASEAPPGAIFFAPPMAVVAVPRPPVFNPILRPPLGMPIVAAPIILPPTSSGPFPSTSPMLMAPGPGTYGPFPRLGSFPRVGTFPHVGSFPHGGLMGARR
jgi:hypothetical protein